MRHATLHQLKVFATLARHLNMTRAAAELHMINCTCIAGRHGELLTQHQRLDHFRDRIVQQADHAD